MEPDGMTSEANWTSFDSSMPVEESEVMAHLFGAHQYGNEQDQDPNIGTQAMFWTDHNTDSYYSSENANYNPYYWSQGNCSTTSTTSTSSFFQTPSNYENFLLGDLNVAPIMRSSSAPMNSFSAVDEQTAQLINPTFPVRVCDHFNGTVNEEASSEEACQSIEKPPASLLLPHHSSHSKRRLCVGDLEKPPTEGEDSQVEGPKKKAKASAIVPKKGKSAQSKKWQKSASTSNLTESNAEINAQSSSCYSSEDDSNASQEPNGAGATSSSSKGNLNLSGKTRAGRGSATDPQSLYARKRRERINERLRILQNLVPNGTKVDISTMLEEAVQYVKFLQLQIKLLSSDDLWMYAPIAYNGMNLGIDLMISPPSQLPNGINSVSNPR